MMIGVQVEEVVDEPLKPENIHLPSIYVQRVVKGERYDKVIEVHYTAVVVALKSLLSIMQRRTTRARGQESTRLTPTNDRERQRDRIVRRAALEFHDGMYGKSKRKYTYVCINVQHGCYLSSVQLTWVLVFRCWPATTFLKG